MDVARFDFERLFAELSVDFARRPVADTHHTINDWLNKLSDRLGFEAGVLIVLSEKGALPGSKCEPTLRDVMLHECINSGAPLRSGEVVWISREHSHSETELRNFCAVPVAVDGTTYVLAFGHRHRQVAPPDNVSSCLRAVGQVFAGALARKGYEDFLSRVAQAVSVGSDDSLFTLLLHDLVRVTHADAALIGNQLDDQRVRTVAVLVDNRVIHNFEYNPENPCLKSVFEMPYHVSLQLRNSAGCPIGVVAVFGRRAFGDPVTVNAVLRVVAVRASRELERANTESMLRDIETKNRALLAALPDLIFLMDETGVYLDCHSNDPQRFYVTPHKFLGRNIREIMPEDFCKRVFQKFAEAAASGEPAVLEYSLPRDGKTEFFEARIVKRADGNFLAIVREQTDKKRAEDELQRVSMKLRRFEDEERRRIARELHDVTAQNLFGISLHLQALRPLASSNENRILQECQTLCEKSLNEIREISYHLYPPAIEHVGFFSALRWYVDEFARRSRRAVKLHLDQDLVQMPSDVERTLFRIVQSFMTNIVLCSDEAETGIHVKPCRGEVVLEINTSWNSWSPNTSEAALWLSLGLPGMTEHLREIGGEVEMESSGRRSRIVVRVALARDQQLKAASV